MRMPATFKTGAAFAALVEDADLLATDGPSASELWYQISQEEEQQVRHFARTVLWLALDPNNRAERTDLIVPECLRDHCTMDLRTREKLEYYFPGQVLYPAQRLDDELRAAA